jgi:hypothetical protein
MIKHILLAVLFFLAACAPAAETAATPQLIRVHATASTQPWLAQAYTCADGLQLVLSNVDDPRQADISIRLGEPEQLTTSAYQIDLDDLLVVTHRESPLQNMTLAEVRQLFAGTGSQPVQIWVYAAGEDVQQVFAREVLHGQVVTSLARVAFSPQQMSDTLNRDKNAVGILPRHWKAGSVRDIFSFPGVPVLAVLKSEPQGPIKALLACLQK